MANLIDQITTPQSNLDGTEQLYGVKDETIDVRFPTQLVADLVVVSTSQIQDNAVVSAKVSEAIRLSLGKAAALACSLMLSKAERSGLFERSS